MGSCPARARLSDRASRSSGSASSGCPPSPQDAREVLAGVRNVWQKGFGIVCRQKTHSDELLADEGFGVTQETLIQEVPRQVMTEGRHKGAGPRRGHSCQARVPPAGDPNAHPRRERDGARHRTYSDPALLSAHAPSLSHQPRSASLLVPKVISSRLPIPHRSARLFPHIIHDLTGAFIPTVSCPYVERRDTRDADTCTSAHINILTPVSPGSWSSARPALLQTSSLVPEALSYKDAQGSPPTPTGSLSRSARTGSPHPSRGSATRCTPSP